MRIFIVASIIVIFFLLLNLVANLISTYDVMLLFYVNYLSGNC